MFAAPSFEIALAIVIGSYVIFAILGAAIRQIARRRRGG